MRSPFALLAVFALLAGCTATKPQPAATTPPNYPYVKEGFCEQIDFGIFQEHLADFLLGVNERIGSGERQTANCDVTSNGPEGKRGVAVQVTVMIFESAQAAGAGFPTTDVKHTPGYLEAAEVGVQRLTFKFDKAGYNVYMLDANALTQVRLSSLNPADVDESLAEPVKLFVRDVATALKATKS